MNNNNFLFPSEDSGTPIFTSHAQTAPNAQESPEPLPTPPAPDSRDNDRAADIAAAAPAAAPKSHILSLPARIGLWIVSVAVGATLLMLCAVAWVFGIGYLGDALSADKQPVTPDSPYPGFSFGSGNGGESDSTDDDFFISPDDDFPWGDFFGGSTPDNDSNDGGSSSAPQANGTPGMGVTVSAIEPEFAIDGYTGGLLIIAIKEKSAFEGLDVKVNDLILAVNGTATPDLDSFDKELVGYEVGDEITLTIARYKSGVASTFDVDITLIDISSND